VILGPAKLSASSEPNRLLAAPPHLFNRDRQRASQRITRRGVCYVPPAVREWAPHAHAARGLRPNSARLSSSSGRFFLHSFSMLPCHHHHCPIPPFSDQCPRHHRWPQPPAPAARRRYRAVSAHRPPQSVASVGPPRPPTIPLTSPASLSSSTSMNTPAPASEP
jgi:hypothetical protein